MGTLTLVCCVCNRIYGEKDSLSDFSGESHGICPECFPKEMERLRVETEKYRKERKEKSIKKEEEEGGEK